MMHPMEFTQQVTGGVYAAGYAVNTSQIAQLQQLIQVVKNAGLRIVPLGRINLDAPNITLTGRTTPLPPAAQTCNCVAFRLSNVQDYYLTLGQEMVAGSLAQFGFTFTAGIIGADYGADSNLVGFMQGIFSNTTLNPEVACNGYDGESYFSLPANEQQSTMLDGIKAIQLQTGRKPTTFIPPYGDFTSATWTACEENDVNVFSSISTRDKPPYQLSDPTNGLYRLSSAASTSDPENTEYLIGVTAADTYNMIQAQLYRDGFCVVNVNPDEFHEFNGTAYNNNVLNQTMVNEFQILLQLVKASGLRVVTVGQIPSFVGVPLTTGVMTTGVPTTGVPTTGVPTTGVMTTGASTGVHSSTNPTTGSGVASSTAASSTVASSTAAASSTVASSTAAASSTQSTDKASSTQQPITTTIEYESSTNVIAYSMASLLFVLLLL